MSGSLPALAATAFVVPLGRHLRFLAVSLLVFHRTRKGLLYCRCATESGTRITIISTSRVAIIIGTYQILTGQLQTEVDLLLGFYQVPRQKGRVISTLGQVLFVTF
ncbi:hypothetical protein K503DRAFT_768529 [Rhizopogon vinicolor AM-OR11-026]|uniref:Uncharacterized protein n=1 Tax=Rhizopogon vinicolor AM-OR11-026 TaxID=1314800 RepID=A0A1B7N6P3_9AGAM|nr:hypothetical protein K503DRAFT_768529 [Rhizopogon vinicolor AM-OR11-026]